jgi:ring-1,2-phenylacetyl-CoA epoxidase subunit PaaD
MAELSKEAIFNVLSCVEDPEIPVLNIVEMGIVRDVLVAGNDICITITPTYSGCPAMKVIEDQVIEVMRNKGYQDVTLQTVLSPAWTTDWMTDEAKEKLTKYGIAAPGKAPKSSDLVMLSSKHENTKCPFCKSSNTKETSEFGSTPCKSLYYCNACNQPFEYFKPF